ncbi:hypothetical protein [Phyllobacterium pellucidum]|uniref:hypothetical protein n=1 Tax=Phyllobacterium pellucidum TaxID=2740464 RepID=UPI001D141E3B|nr:hypothetical protein [Phyllobacterium sp. T1018]UGY08644.1 hypothetical protein LLE51_011405 [Phyllobacterium sp. T1018]
MTDQAINLLSQATGLVSALILYWQTFGVEWGQQTIKGGSAFEQRTKARQKRLGIIGVALAVFSIGCQMYLTL